MLLSVLSLYKPLGLTPLAAIRLWQHHYPEYTDSTIGYAGRLDPMAEGLLLCLVNEEDLKRKTYEKLPKEYEFSLLFGITTDTYDLLGKITSVQREAVPPVLKEQLVKLIPSLKGKRQQFYPPYSSPRVQGKPLFAWAREGKLEQITLPAKEIEISALTLRKIHIVAAPVLKKTIIERIRLVNGDFRQGDIIKGWESFFASADMAHLSLATFHISCSSGTYVRSLGQELGEMLGCGAVVFNLQRTRVGPYTIQESQKLTLL